MATSRRDELVDWCRELLAPLGAVRVKRMFGGHGFYVDEIFIAIHAFERLYLKTDDAARPLFEAAGCVPFRGAGRAGRHRQGGAAYGAGSDRAARKTGCRAQRR